MTTDDYITTTGERWHEGAPFNEGWIPTLLRDESENDEDCTIVRPPDILAELRALRAQRDELLAALQGLDRHEAMACIVEPPCGYCRACNARATLRRAKGEA